MKISRVGELALLRKGQLGSPSVEPLLGRWLNTNAATQGLAETIVATGPSGPTLRLLGVGEEGTLDWGVVPLELFFNLEEEDGKPTVAALAAYELGFMAVGLQIRVNRGVLVVAHFTEFKDGSGRSNYFNREFFRLAVGT